MNKTLKILLTIITIVFISILVSTPAFAGFADMTDEQAQINEQQHIEAEQTEHIQDNYLKSSNNNLKSLTVDGYKLSPEFNSQTINYTLNKNVSDKTITINAEAEDEKATIHGAGKVKVGKDQAEVEVSVEAESGTYKTYFIKVNEDAPETVLTENDIVMENTTSIDENNQVKSDIESQTKESKFDIKYVIIAIVIIIILVIIFTPKKHKKRSRHSA